MTSPPVVPVAAIEALVDWLMLAGATSTAPEERAAYAGCESRLRALVAEHQSSAEGDCCQMHGQREPYPTPESGTREPGCSCPVADSAPEVRLTDEERESLPGYARDVLVWRAVEAIVASRTEPLRAERDEWMERAHGTSVALIAEATAQITAERDEARDEVETLRQRFAAVYDDALDSLAICTCAGCRIARAALGGEGRG